MKRPGLLLLLPGIFALQTAFAQQTNHVTLSDPYPSAGETINLTYDPSGTVLAGKEGIEGRVFFMDNKKFPVGTLSFTPDSKLLKSSFTVPDSAKAFFIKLYKDEDVDNNNDTGYIYPVYKDKIPVAGAYASEGYISIGLGMSFAKIKMLKPNESIALYKKDFDLHPEIEKSYGDMYYTLLARSNNPANQPVLNAHIAELEKTGTEASLQMAAALYNFQRKRASADSLFAIIETKYPNGSYALTKLYREFNATTDLGKRDSLFALMQKAHQAPVGEGVSNITDMCAAAQASKYNEKGDIDNTMKYIALIQNKAEIRYIANEIAYDLAKKGEHLDEAAKLSKQSLDLTQEEVDNPHARLFQTAEDAKKSAKNTYYGYADTYAFILFKQGHTEEALKYQQQVYGNTKPLDAEEMEHYLLILNASGKYQQAKLAAEENIKNNKSSAIIETELKKAYVKLNGSDKGYDKYMAVLQVAAKQKAREELAKIMINKPAPQFALKDFDGNTVSLADLKGKVVIVDFWATWCGPCKASFPGMQLAVNKYKDNPNVKFLFVDCWENGDKYEESVKKFIADNKYTFHVLFDEKDGSGKQSKVNSQFGVSGIPTKFIIDKNGNIRFSFVGYSGTAEGVLHEVSDMIEMAANPDSITGQKVSMNN